MEYELELYHHGIKGMRWGIRRYQTKDGGLTPAGRKRYNADMEKIKAETRKIKNQQRTAKKLSKLKEAKQNLKNLKKSKGKGEPEKEVETDEQKKERILKAPSAKDVYENRHLFSNKEIQDLSLRIQNEENIRKNIPQQVDAGKARAEKFFGNVENATKNAVTLAKAYNTIANVVNAFGNNPVSLPKIELDNTKGNKVTRQQEKKALKEEQKKAKEEAAAEKKAQKEAKEAEKVAKVKAKQEQTKAEAWREGDKTYSSDPTTNYRSGPKVKTSTSTTSSSTVNTGQSIASKTILALPAPTSNLPSTTVNRGKSTVAGLLTSGRTVQTGQDTYQTIPGEWDDYESV